MLIFVTCSLAACAPSASAHEAVGPDPFAGRAASDLSGYASLEGLETDVFLVDTTVAELAQLMDGVESFAFVAAYADCPYCNRIMPYLNEAAAQAGRKVGYLNTRADASWKSNLDIDDYDRFVECFGTYLEEDDDGVKHLYTPDLYFVRNGKVVANHPGVTPGADDPDQPLTEEQEKELQETLAEEFALLT